MNTNGIKPGDFVTRDGKTWLVDEVLPDSADGYWDSLMVSDQDGATRQIFSWDSHERIEAFDRVDYFNIP